MLARYRLLLSNFFWVFSLGCFAQPKVQQFALRVGWVFEEDNPRPPLGPFVIYGDGQERDAEKFESEIDPKLLDYNLYESEDGELSSYMSALQSGGMIAAEAVEMEPKTNLLQIIENKLSSEKIFIDINIHQKGQGEVAEFDVKLSVVSENNTTFGSISVNESDSETVINRLTKAIKITADRASEPKTEGNPR